MLKPALLILLAVLILGSVAAWAGLLNPGTSADNVPLGELVFITNAI